MLLLSCMDKGLFSGATVKVCNNFYTIFDGSHAGQNTITISFQVRKVTLEKLYL